MLCLTLSQITNKFIIPKQNFLTYYHTLPVSFLSFTEMRSSRLNLKHIFKWMMHIHAKKKYSFCKNYGQMHKKLMTAINHCISLNKEIILLLKRHDFWITCDVNKYESICQSLNKKGYNCNVSTSCPLLLWYQKLWHNPPPPLSPTPSPTLCIM